MLGVIRSCMFIADAYALGWGRGEQEGKKLRHRDPRHFHAKRGSGRGRVRVGEDGLAVIGGSWPMFAGLSSWARPT